MSEIRLLPAVLDDTAEAARWYEEKGYEGLGTRFIAVFHSRLLYIQQYGESYRVVYGEFRRVLVNPFPYAVYFRFHGDWIVVSLVIHTSRSPRLIRRPLRERRSEPASD